MKYQPFNQSDDHFGELSDSLMDELDRRKLAAEKDPDTLIAWESIKARLELGTRDPR